jgi:hypothetical protein
MRPVFAARRRTVTRSVWPCETTSMLIESTWGWSGLVCCRRIGTDSSREPGQGQSVKTGTCPGGWVAVESWHATGGVGGAQPHERDELIPTTTRDLSGASAAPFPRVGQELRRAASENPRCRGRSSPRSSPGRCSPTPCASPTVQYGRRRIHSDKSGRAGPWPYSALRCPAFRAAERSKTKNE